MKLIRTSNVFGDETALYDVVDYKATTVGEFITEVLKEFPREWGYIEIENVRYEYSDGIFLPKLPFELLQKSICSITGNGGWSRMDYSIKTTDTEKKSSENILKKELLEWIKGQEEMCECNGLQGIYHGYERALTDLRKFLNLENAR